MTAIEKATAAMQAAVIEADKARIDAAQTALYANRLPENPDRYDHVKYGMTQRANVGIIRAATARINKNTG